MRLSPIVLGLALAAVSLAPVIGHADPKPAAAPSRPEPSGPLKAYKGPEGEIVVMVEADDGKQMYVHPRNISKEIDGKTVLYLIEDLGHGNKNVYVNKKRGSKTYHSNLLSCRDGRWDFYPPGKDTSLSIRYSESASKDFKIEDVLSAYKP
jgi:hypothetical protein